MSLRCPAKAAAWTEVLFWVETPGGPRNIVLDGINGFNAIFAKLLLPLLLIMTRSYWYTARKSTVKKRKSPTAFRNHWGGGHPFSLTFEPTGTIHPIKPVFMTQESEHREY